MEESQLISRLKNGDEAAFMEVVQEYKKKVISLCYSYTKDTQEAEDLSQEVFLGFYKSINRFRGDSSISTYLYKITVSKCLDYKRKNKSLLFDFFFHEKSYTNDVEDNMYIRECILKLPNDLKNVVMLYYHIGLSQREIGNIVDISEKAVEGRIYRAKQKLKKEFEMEEIRCNQDGII